MLPSHRRHYAIRNAIRQRVWPLFYGLVADANLSSRRGYVTAEKFKGFGFEHAALNHSSRLFATIVQSSEGNLCDMGAPTEYKDRLEAGMKAANVDAKALALHVGVSYQAIKKVLVGSSGMLRADNNVLAARYLQVNSEWLATGEGEQMPNQGWPLTAELLARLHNINADQRLKAENQLRFLLDMDLMSYTPSGKPKQVG